MRVVSGLFGGRRLIAPPGQHTRPTTDKVRQAVFNMLDSAGLIDGATVVDVFAGSGALGIEALSRGAANCVFVERDRAALGALRQNLDTLGVVGAKVVAGDAMGLCGTLGAFDLALVDPPYSFDQWAGLLELLDAADVIAESDREVSGGPGWETVRSRRYGRTVITWLHRLA
jgi:16S rRNA (guanine966-N2)-methyltransferase